MKLACRYFFSRGTDWCKLPYICFLYKCLAALPNLSICQFVKHDTWPFYCKHFGATGRFGQRELQQVDWKFGSCLDSYAQRSICFGHFLLCNSFTNSQNIGFCSPKVSSLQCPKYCWKKRGRVDRRLDLWLRCKWCRHSPFA